MRDLVFGPKGYAPPADAEAPTFAVDSTAIPPSVVGLDSYTSSNTIAPRVDRARAMQVGAVKRSRDLIAGTLGTLPLELFGPDRRQTQWPLFTQPEPDVARSVTMARTFEDLLFEGVAWWRVTARDYRGWPTAVKRQPAGTVQVVDATAYVDGKAVPAADLIRFLSPTDGLLIAGARAIRTCLLLDVAAANMADGVPPVDWFSPAEGVDPADDAIIEEILNGWAEARRKRSTAYVPAALKYNVAGWDPEKLQLAEARKEAKLQVANEAGIDPEDLGISTTSRTYFNGFDRRKQLIDFTFAPYMLAVQERLSMRDVTQQGYAAVFNPDALIRADAATRWASYEVGLRVGAITRERIAAIEGVPLENVRALPPGDAPTQPEEQTA